MKIAVTHTRWTKVGGSEGYICDLVKRLLDAGHEIDYFCQWWEEGADPRIRFHKVPNLWKPIKWLKVREYDRAIDRLVPLDRWDLVHGFSKSSRQDIYTDGSGCLEDYQAYTLGDQDAGSSFTRALRRLSPHQREVAAIERRRFTRGNFRKIVAMSKLAANQIQRRYGLTDEEVIVVYNGLDLDRFRPENVALFRDATRDELGVPRDAFVLLLVGNDYLRKGVTTLIEALARIRAAGSSRPVRAVVIGRESSRRLRDVVALAKEAGVAGDLVFPGARRDIEKVHAAADAFVLPSRFDIFGNVVLEAMATGVPSIVSAAAGASEVIEEGRSGFVLPSPRDAELLAKRVIELTDDERRRSMGAAAAEAAKRYSWDRHFARILEIYDEVARLKKSQAVRAS